MYRVILDANVLLSYAISTPGKNRTISQLVDAAIDGRFTLVIPAELLSEIERTVAQSRYFRARLDKNRFSAYLEALVVIAEAPEPMTDELERITRDRNDDYLLAASHIYGVEFLVSRDKDLLVLRDMVTSFRIMTPREFLDLIDS